MTTLEHVSVKHRLPSWAGNIDLDTSEYGERERGVNGDQGEVTVGVEAAVGETEAEPEEEVEEVGVGLAVTTDDDDDMGRVQAGVVQPRELLHAEHANDDKRGDGWHRHNETTSCTASGSASMPISVSVSVSAFGSGSGSASGSGSVSGLGSGLDCGPSRHSPHVSLARSLQRSRSPSESNSNSRSQSPSRFSARGPREMGESSSATSWTQADAEGLSGRPSSERGMCQSSADGVGESDVIDIRAPPREKAKVGSPPSHLRTGTEGRGEGESGDVSRKEEMLVMQEEDIGEGWHPSRYNGKERLHDNEQEEGEEEEDVGSAHGLESEHDGGQSLEMNEKDPWRTFGSSGSTSASRHNARHLRLEFKRPSPQPWDETDPPTENNDVYASDYYSTLNSKKFGTLQKRRPLIPHSTYYFGPPPPDSAYGTSPVGQIGVHHPREIVRIERDYGGGELTQFSPVFPLELEGRVTPTQFHQTINDINEILISAHNIRHAFIDNFLAVATLQLSTLVMKSHYIKEMRRLRRKIEELNTQLYNPAGLNILWPQKVAFLFLEIEYY